MEQYVNDYNHSEAALFHAANVLILCGHIQNANTYVDKLLSEYPSSVDGYLVKGWLDFQDNKLKNARNCFRAVLSQVNKFFS